MEAWSTVLNVLVVLTAAFVLGTLAEMFRQNAIVGYLLAGTLVGPHGLGLVESGAHIDLIAELGVALLLFGIGLEFSFRRLLAFGRMAIVGGTLQVVLTTGAGALVCGALGLGFRASLFIGAMVALSSTACVSRVLGDRTALDSAYGRNALGILLLQDVAVVPLTVILSVLGGHVSTAEFWPVIARKLFVVIAVLGGGGFLLSYVVPRLLIYRPWGRNRELPILLASAIAIGSAIAAHGMGFSPAIGAFVAGMLVAESPLATQVRADVGALRATFLTMFFAAVGMLAEPRWIVGHFHLVLGVVGATIVGKTILVWVVAVLLGATSGMALATGLCLAQVGEFSFVLAEIGRSSNVIPPDTFRLLIASSILTLVATPYLVAASPRLARWINRPHVRSESRQGRRKETGETPVPLSLGGERPADREGQDAETQGGRVLVVGFGPAGRRVAEALLSEYADRLLVLDLNPKNAEAARRLGIDVHVGDASQPDVLAHAGVRTARAVVVTLPDFSAARQAIQVCRDLNPDVPIAARGRHHLFAKQLEQAGAQVVIDEENEAGLRLAAQVRRELGLLTDPRAEPGI